jgi:cytochrome c oxidase cbb3-type subunit 3
MRVGIVPAALAVAAIVAVVVLANFGWRAYMNASLLRAAPDAIAGRRDLVRYADSMARPVYQSHCAGCHGADLRGDPARGIPNLVDKDWLYGSGSIAQIQQTITYGIRSGNPKGRSLAVMPAFAHPDPSGREKVNALTPGEIDDLIQFIFSIEGRPSEAAAASRGALLYSDKGVCYDCHSRDAQGDQEIGAPNLSDKIWLYGEGSPQSIFRSIAQGRAGACPAWGQTLSPSMLRALAVYVHDQSSPARRA